MAVRKLAPKVTAQELLRADAARRARPPQRDPTGEHHDAIAQIAADAGRNVADLMDEFDERAAVREYLGHFPRAEAERLAVEDVRSAYARRRTA